MSDRVNGSCLCRVIQFSVQLPTLWAAHCHCTQCQRAHGAPLVTWLGVTLDRFKIEEGQELLCWFNSSPEAQRGFCSVCGSTLFFRSPRWEGEMHISYVNINGELDRVPQGHVHCATRRSWLKLADGLPCFEGLTK